MESQLQQDPASGQWFVFVNRAGDRMKLLGWDGHGLWIWYKLLERGRFELPQADGAHAEIDVTQLSMIIQGVALTAPRRLRYQPRPAG